MDFDQMLAIWRAQNTAQQYDVNREALRKTLQAEAARIQRELRALRFWLWFGGIFGTGMAVWAGFWIAITITNGWPAIYAIAAGASLGIFALGAVALWVSRGPRAERQRNFGNTLQEEVKRSLALVDYQLSATRRWFGLMLGWSSIIVGTGLFSWTLNRSQDIENLSSFRAWSVFTVVFVGLIVWGSLKERAEMRKSKPKLELRQRFLRELLETLDASE